MNMPKRLRKRGGELAKAKRLSFGAFIVLALERFIEEIEAKARAEEERDAREKREKLERRRASPLAPEVIERLSLDEAAPVEAEDVDEDALYTHHAKRVAAALHSDPRELRLRRDEAIAAFVRQAPLTHPPEHEMLAKLERLVKKQPQPKPPAPTPAADDDVGVLEPIITIKESP
jgi:hypothetical protein